MMCTYQGLVDRFHTKGILPNKQLLDKKSLAKYKGVIKKNRIEYELVTQHMHRRNLAKREIQTFNDIFMGIFSGLPYSFTWSLWGELIPEVDENQRVTTIKCGANHISVLSP